MESLTENFIDDMNSSSRDMVRKSIQDLRNYLHVKGIFLLARMHPEDSPFKEKHNVDFIIDYLNNSTNLPTYKFWKNLSRSKQIRICKLMSLRDDDYMQLIIRESKEKDGVLYILLSGKGTVASENDPSKLERIRVGSAFGSVALMEAQAIHRQTQVDENEFTKTATIERGSVLRLKMSDFFKVVRGKGVKSEKAAAVAEIETEFDIWEVLIRDLPVGLMRPVRLLPDSLSQPIFQYKRTGNVGRRLVVKMGEEEMVYIVINGSIKIIFRKDGGGVIECRKRGEKKLKIKTGCMPVMLVESGSIFCINQACFQVPQVAEVPTDVSIRTFDTLPVKKTKKEHVNMSVRRYPPPLVINDHPEPEPDVDPRRFAIDLVFEKTTQYLCIPSSSFKQVMREFSLEAYSEARQHEIELSATIESRIKALGPWIHGKLRLSSGSALGSASLSREEQGEGPAGGSEAVTRVNPISDHVRTRPGDSKLTFLNGSYAITMEPLETFNMMRSSMPTTPYGEQEQERTLVNGEDYLSEGGGSGNASRDISFVTSSFTPDTNGTSLAGSASEMGRGYLMGAVIDEDEEEEEEQEDPGEWITGRALDPIEDEEDEDEQMIDYEEDDQ